MYLVKIWLKIQLDKLYSNLPGKEFSFELLICSSLQKNDNVSDKFLLSSQAVSHDLTSGQIKDDIYYSSLS